MAILYRERESGESMVLSVLLLAIIVASGIYTYTQWGVYRHSNPVALVTFDKNSLEASTISSTSTSTPSSSTLPRTSATTKTPSAASVVPVSVYQVVTTNNTNAITTGGDVSITVPRGPLTRGDTYPITWTPSGNLTSYEYSSVKIELIEPYRADRGPVLVAAYTEPLGSLPRTLQWTVPQSLVPGTTYALKLTYATSHDNYFGSNGFSGKTYRGTSVYFTVADDDSEGLIKLTTTTQPGTQHVAPDTKGVTLVRANISSDRNSILTYLAVGSPEGNEIFNHVENLKALVAGETIPMEFTNEYLQGTTLWRLTTPLTLSANSTTKISLVADIKPGHHPTSVVTSIKGGRATVPVSGRVDGSTLIIEED